MVLTTGTGGHQQENRGARADRWISAERAAQIEGLLLPERRVEHDDVGARRARPLEHRGFGEHTQHGVPASPERSDDVREGVVLIAGDEDARRTSETVAIRHKGQLGSTAYPSPMPGFEANGRAAEVRTGTPGRSRQSATWCARCRTR